MTDHIRDATKKVLSPAAKAVLDAYYNAAKAVLDICGDFEIGSARNEGIAAAIRALADQLRLDLPLGDTDADAGVFAAHHAIYAAILAISTELEN